MLDDVLVNFDTRRAEAAVAVLRDFAAAGHQVLVFTCHEHMLRMFQSLKVPAGRLPDARESVHAAVVFEEPAKERPKRARKSPAPRKTAARIKPPELPEGAAGQRRDDEPGDDVPWEAGVEADFGDADDEDWDDDQGHHGEGGAAAA